MNDRVLGNFCNLSIKFFAAISISVENQVVQISLYHFFQQLLTIPPFQRPGKELKLESKVRDVSHMVMQD